MKQSVLYCIDFQKETFTTVKSVQDIYDVQDRYIIGT